MKKFTLMMTLLLMAAMVSSQGCNIFSFGGCTRGGYVQGVQIRVSELITRKGCQTLRCPRVDSYIVTANSQGVISYSKDEDGLCWPNSTKLTFSFAGINLPNFSNLSGSVNLSAPPSSITIGGWGIDTYYGTPILHLYDYNNRFIGQQWATNVAGDGSWATFNMEPLTNPWSGTYHARILRARWDGNYEEIGDAAIDCYGMPRVDEDGDGSYCDEDCNDENPYISPWSSADCSGSLWDANCNGQYDPFEYECDDPNDCGPQYRGGQQSKGGEQNREQWPCEYQTY
jgi:hypothetical protein